MVAALSENFLDPIFLAKVAFAHKLDVAAVFRRQPLGILPQPVAERLGEPRVVENADVALVQVRGHALGKADPRQRAEQQDPIPAGKRPRDLRCVAFRQQRQAHSGIIPWSNNLFGSGYAGLGYLSPQTQTCIPPIELPMMSRTWRMPSPSDSNRYCASTISA